jgi:SAM-dependent methyltransferase
MYYEAHHFTKHVKEVLPEYFVNKTVLDIGSADINGNNRFLFSNCEYIGNDVIPYINVDIVCVTSELPFNHSSFDVIVSTECFEHDMQYPASLKKVTELLKEDGLFFFTCATTNRAEHGTTRTDPSSSLTSQLESWQDYYKNLTVEDIKKVIDCDKIFSYYEFYTNSRSCDLYFWGIKKGKPLGRTVKEYVAPNVIRKAVSSGV